MKIDEHAQLTRMKKLFCQFFKVVIWVELKDSHVLQS